MKPLQTTKLQFKRKRLSCYNLKPKNKRKREINSQPLMRHWSNRWIISSNNTKRKQVNFNRRLERSKLNTMKKKNWSLKLMKLLRSLTLKSMISKLSSSISCRYTSRKLVTLKTNQAIKEMIQACQSTNASSKSKRDSTVMITLRRVSVHLSNQIEIELSYLKKLKVI